MCTYTYSWYICNHSYYIWTDTIEICTNRFLSTYSYDAWSIGKRQMMNSSSGKTQYWCFLCLDMCNDHIATCKGFGNFFCSDCSEDYTLEYELDEWKRVWTGTNMALLRGWVYQVEHFGKEEFVWIANSVIDLHVVIVSLYYRRDYSVTLSFAPESMVSSSTLSLILIALLRASMYIINSEYDLGMTLMSRSTVKV